MEIRLLTPFKFALVQGTAEQFDYFYYFPFRRIISVAFYEGIARMTNLTGQDIGRYRIIEPLGQGGMAVVYRAFDTRLECDVAVKFIRMEQLPPVEVEKALKRFEREAKEVARLTHPNIVKVTDYGEYHGTPYLVMPYLSGGSLKELAGKPMPYEQAARLLAPVGRALEYAHEKNLIHRDIKPGNILLTDRGQPLVADFGIAKILDVESGHTLTSTNVAVGTPDYMAPEQWFNQVSAQSDIYSLGVVFYEMVTGRRPYTADTPAAIFLKQSNDPLPRPRSFVDGLPEEVEKVLYKALAKKPEERYASMGEFASALEGLAGLVKSDQPSQQEVFKKGEIGSVIPASPQPIPGRSTPTGSGILPVSLPLKTSSAKPSINGWIWVAIGTIVAVGLVALVGIFALIGWGVSKYPANPAATQNLKGLAVLPSTVTPAPPIAVVLSTSTPSIEFTKTETPAATATSVQTPTPSLGIGSRQISSYDGMVMVYVPAGEFLMGSDKTKDSQAEADELPQHTVYLDAYWIDQTNVTNAMYAECVTAKKCTLNSQGSFTRTDYFSNKNYADYPAINISWFDAHNYCEWAGRRLPGEAEWEKAARGTNGNIYPWGNSIDCTKANYPGCSKGDTVAENFYPAGASPYGALDMGGNVWEWVEDWYSDTYYQKSPSKNPTGPSTGTSRVLRAGSWYGNVWYVRTANRFSDLPNDIYYSFGFRCATSP